MIRRLAAVTFLALAACAPRQETAEQMAARMKAESDSARTAIEAANLLGAKYWAAGRADSVAMLYAEDGVFMFPNAPAVRGRAAIQAAVSAFMSYGSWRMTPTSTRVDANGPLAVEQGTYVEEFTPGPNAPPGMAAMFPDSGKYVVAWKKVNGTWQVYADIVNTSRPVPTPGAKRR